MKRTKSDIDGLLDIDSFHSGAVILKTKPPALVAQVKAGKVTLKRVNKKGKVKFFK